MAQFELRFNPDGRGASQVVGERFGLAGQPWQISEKGCEIEGIVADHDLDGPLSQGVFIAHDGAGDSPSNYKIVPWARIAAILAGRPAASPGTPATAPGKASGHVD